MMPETPFVQLDFEGRSQIFRDFQRFVTTASLAEVKPCLAEVDAALAEGLQAVGFIAYEAAPAFDPAMRVPQQQADLPLLWFGLVAAPEEGDLAGQTDQAGGDYAFGDWAPSVDADTYRDIFARVQRHIHDGDTYQINYTFPLHSTFHGDIRALYAGLRRAQTANYCAWIHTPAWDIVSASPELFFKRRGQRLVTRPMKGTRRRGMTLATDRAIADELRANPKDRAENVMIVDLLRNDMGRLAKLGSIRPTALFTLERYPTVWQMTSTIEAELSEPVSLSRLFGGLFPCGSVTGAPKIKTMEIIAREEHVPRGVYCGAIGHATAADCTFNVPIRTLLLRNGRVTYPVGSGLVADSEAAAEYDECLAKARVIAAAATPRFELLETLLCEPGHGFFLLDRHLRRLRDSADYFGYCCDLDEVRRSLLAVAAACEEASRVRLLVAADGAIRTETYPMAASRLNIRRVTLASEPVQRNNPFLYHKTTHRQVYEQAYARRGAADDVILYNQEGELTETVFTNLALLLDGRWLTPPVSCGLLAGTMRAELLDQGLVAEGIVHRDDLEHAEGIMLFNSVRKKWTVTLLDESP